MVAWAGKKVVTRAVAWQRLCSRFACHIPSIDRGSTLDWGTYYLPDYYTHKPSTLHLHLSDVFDRLFERRGRRAVVIGPRGGAKSTVSTLTHPLRKAVEGVEPYILLLSDTDSQAVENLANIKLELEDNSRLAQDFPHAVGKGPIWRENYIKLRNGVVIHAAGTGTKIRGRRVRHQRPTSIIADDLENDDHIESAVERQRTETWFNRTVMNMGDSRTNIIVLGTAMHRESLLMKLQRRAGWIVRRERGKPAPFRAIEHWPYRMDLWDDWEKVFNNPDDEHAERKARKFFKRNRREMERGAELCWPDREPLYFLMKLRAEIGSAAFDAEKQGNPIDPSTCEWPERYFTHDRFWFDEWPDDLVIRGMSLDPSKGKNDKRHDYSAIASGGVSRDGIVYVDLNMDKRPTDQIVADVVSGYDDFKPCSIAIETNQFQELLAEDISDAAEEWGVPIHITPMENFTAKRVRIRRLSSLLSQKRIRFMRGSDGAQLAVQQTRDFPNGDHDDGPDAVEMLCRLMFAKLEDDGEDEFDKHLHKIMGQFQ